MPSTCSIAWPTTPGAPRAICRPLRNGHPPGGAKAPPLSPTEGNTIDSFTRQYLTERAHDVAATIAGYTPAAIEAIEVAYQREHGYALAGVGYVTAYGDLLPRAKALVWRLQLAIKEDAELETKRPSITKLMAEASARMGYAPDMETADYEARVTAAAVVAETDLATIVALAAGDDRLSCYRITERDDGRMLDSLLADRLEELLAEYLREQWADATASETGNAGLRAARQQERAA